MSVNVLWSSKAQCQWMQKIRVRRDMSMPWGRLFFTCFSPILSSFPPEFQNTEHCSGVSGGDFMLSTWAPCKWTVRAWWFNSRHPEGVRSRLDNYISTLETLILTKPNEINSGVMTQPFHEAIKGDPTSINTAPVPCVDMLILVFSSLNHPGHRSQV